MCDKATYMRYLQGEGIRYGNSNMYINTKQKCKKEHRRTCIAEDRTAS